MIIFLISSCSSLSSDSFTKEEVVYGNREGSSLMADLWLPKSSKPLPLVILVHGGSWKSRTRKDMDTTAKDLIKEGFAVLNISYTLVPKALYPAQIENFEQAVDWVRANALAHQIDTSKLFSWGYSAGAQIAALGALKSKTKFKAIVDGAGPMDMELYPDDKAIQEYLGKDQDYFNKLKDSSPINFITKNSPAFFIYHSPNDKIVDPQHSKNLIKELEKHKIKYRFHSVPVLGHILTFLLSKESRREAIKFLKEQSQN